jgi:hypothetical protein
VAAAPLTLYMCARVALLLASVVLSLSAYGTGRSPELLQAALLALTSVCGAAEAAASAPAAAAAALSGEQSISQQAEGDGDAGAAGWVLEALRPLRRLAGSVLAAAAEADAGGAAAAVGAAQQGGSKPRTGKGKDKDGRVGLEAWAAASVALAARLGVPLLRVG